MMAAIVSILVCLASGISLALILAVSAAFLAEEHYTLTSLWRMGVTPLAALYGAFVSILISPLMIWAYRDWSDRQAIRRGLVLWAVLACYFVGVSALTTWLQFTDSYSLATFLVPLAISILGLVSIGRTSRG